MAREDEVGTRNGNGDGDGDDDVDRAAGRALFEAAFALIDAIAIAAARRARLDLDESEDFRSYVMMKLIDDNYGRLRKYQGKSSLRTYLTVVVKRLVLDYRIQKWGRWRPSTRARELGEVAVQLEELIHRDGLGLREASEILRTNRGLRISEEALAQMALELPRRYGHRRAAWVEPETLGVPPRDSVDEAEKRRYLHHLAVLLERGLERLDAEDQLLLRLRFMEGWSVAQLAGYLKLEARPLYPRIQKLLRRLRSELAGAGIRWEDIRALLDGGLPLSELSLDERGVEKDLARMASYGR